MSRMRGFTLISLLAVMAVMALLSAILFPRICQTPQRPANTQTIDSGPQTMADGDV